MKITYLPVAQLGRGFAGEATALLACLRNIKPCREASQELWEVGLSGLSRLEAELLGCGMAPAAPCPAVQQLYEFQRISVILVCPGGIWTRQVRAHHLGILPRVLAWFLGVF